MRVQTIRVRLANGQRCPAAAGADYKKLTIMVKSRRKQRKTFAYGMVSMSEPWYGQLFGPDTGQTLDMPEAREDAAPSTTVEVESKSMLHLQSSDVQVYKVALYNRNVRALVRERKRHGCFGDRWAEIQSRDVVARDEAEARLLIAERFPPEDGFVVAEIAPAYVPGGRWPGAWPAAAGR